VVVKPQCNLGLRLWQVNDNIVFSELEISFLHFWRVYAYDFRNVNVVRGGKYVFEDPSAAIPIHTICVRDNSHRVTWLQAVL